MIFPRRADVYPLGRVLKSMSRAKRHYLPGLIWHITHRCHKREFLFRFAKDKRAWVHWILVAKKIYGLCVLNYMITSNHIHLLILDDGESDGQAIAKSLHLAEARVAQEYNKRKERSGAFWEDRYHATAIETGEHFINCLTYIDLNMVRAKVVDHPGEWPFCGYYELQQAHQRLRNQIVNLRELSSLLGMNDLGHLRASRAQWIARECQTGELARDPRWTECVAVGSQRYIERIREELKGKAKGREIQGEGERFVLQEEDDAYLRVFGAENEDLRPKKGLIK
jgi:putative transposase